MRAERFYSVKQYLIVATVIIYMQSAAPALAPAPALPPSCPQSRQEDFLQELEDDIVDEEEEGGQQEQRQDEEKGMGGDRVFGLEVIQEVRRRGGLKRAC